MAGKLNLKFTLKTKAYSLIELILALALSSILILCLSSIFNIGQLSLSKSFLERKSGEENSFVLDYIKDEISKAKYYYKTDADSSIVIVKDAVNNISTKGKYEHICYINYNKNIYRITFQASTLHKINVNNSSCDGKNKLAEGVSLKSNLDGNLLTLEIRDEKKTLIKKEIALRSIEVQE